jgi:hypothetical protein
MQYHNRVNLITWLTLASVLFVIGFTSTISYAAKKKKTFQSVWQDVKEVTIDSFGERQIVPSKYRSVRLNKKILSELLDSAPKDSANFSSCSGGDQRIYGVSRRNGGRFGGDGHDDESRQRHLRARFGDSNDFSRQQYFDYLYGRGDRSLYER